MDQKNPSKLELYAAAVKRNLLWLWIIFCLTMGFFWLLYQAGIYETELYECKMQNFTPTFLTGSNPSPNLPILPIANLSEGNKQYTNKEVLELFSCQPFKNCPNNWRIK